MRICYALRLPTREAAEAAASLFASEGFEITWGVDAANDTDSPAQVERTRSRMQALADELNGEFLGNGSFELLPPPERSSRRSRCI